MTLGISGKNAIVTGGARGIGLSLVKGLLESGANVLVLDKNFKDSELLQCQENISLLEIDLSVKKEYAILIDFVSNHYKKIDIIINNAGVTYPSQPNKRYSVCDFEKTLQINLTAPFLILDSLLPFLKKSDGASIINITSLNSDLGFPNNPAYVASKSALAGLTRSLAVDLGHFGIRANSLAPGYIKTAMTGDSWNNLEKRKKRQARTCLDRWGTPKDLIGPMLFLASDMSRYVTGQTLFVDGGWTIKGL